MSKYCRQTARLILLLSLIATSGGTAFAQIAADGRGTSHVFPQVVDGTLAGSRVSYKSALIVSATDSGESTACTFELVGMPSITMTDARGTSVAGTVFNFTMDPGGWQVISSSSDQNLSRGSARLHCDRVVVAQVRYTLRIDGRVASEATVSSASPGSMLQFLADQRDGARVGVAVTNPHSITADYNISLIDLEGRNIGSIVIRLAPGTSLSGFIDEIAG